MLATSVLAGCTSKFEAEKTQPLKAQSVLDTGVTGGVPITIDNENPGTVNTPVGPIHIPDLINDPSGTLVNLVTQLKLPYGVLAKPIELALGQALNQYVRTTDCDKVGTATDTRPPEKQYKCGEIPFGNIINSSEKFIYQVAIPSTWGTQDGTNFWVGSGSTQIHLSRYQRQGSIAIELLDSKTGTQQVGTHDVLAKDLFLRLSPKNGVLDAGVCFTVPGTTVAARPLWVPGNINRTLLWIIDLNANLSINVNLGQASFDSIKSCVSVSATYNKKTGLPEIKITGIEQPKIQNLSLTGFTVKTDTTVTGFMGVVISVLDFFGAGLKQMIADSVNAAVRQEFNNQAAITTAQVTSGEWLLEMLQFQYLKPLLVDNINKALDKTQDVSGKQFQFEVGKWLGAGCLTLVNSYANQQQALTLNQLYSLCKSIPDIQLNAFLDDAEMSAKGCYDRFFSVETLIKDPSIWWHTQCAIKNEVIVTAPKSMMPVFQCLADAVNSNFTNVDSCRPYMDEVIALLKSGKFDSYLNSIAQIEPYLTDSNVAGVFASIQDIAKQFFGYNFNFVYDPSMLSQLAQILGITPSMTLDTITSAGTKNLSVINVDIANAKNLLQALIDRKNAGTAPDVILLQNANSDAARKFIKDINYSFVAMGPTKDGFSNDAGIAILSKYKIIQSSNFSWGNNCLGSACNNNQGIIHARIQVDGVPHPVEIMNTQFQSKQAAQAVNMLNLLDFTQNKQLLDFAAYFAKNALTDLPLILGGDFESDVNSRIYQQLLQFLKARNGGKECADVVACAIAAGSQRFELWFNSFDHQFIRNSSKVIMKPLKGNRAFKTSDLEAAISNGGALEMVYQLSWKP